MMNNNVMYNVMYYVVYNAVAAEDGSILIVESIICAVLCNWISYEHVVLFSFVRIRSQ